MIADDVALETGVRVFHPTLVNLYGCTIGAGTTMGPFVEIQRGASIGRSCKISSHSFICDGVAIEDGVFIGHGVKFTNDLYPRAVNYDGSMQRAGDWKLVRTLVKTRASIGSNATILAGVTIGEGAIVGAGVPKPRVMPFATHVYHVYAIRSGRRQQWRGALQELGIETGIHYPTPVHLLPAFADLGYLDGQFPESEKAAREVLSLPMFPEMTVEQSERVADAVRSLAIGAERIVRILHS